MGNNEITKINEISKTSDAIDEAARNANEFMQNTWNQFEVIDEISDKAGKAGDIAQSLLADTVVDFKLEDERVRNELADIYSNVDSLIDEKLKIEIPLNPEIKHDLLKATSPAVTILGQTYLNSAILLNTEVSDSSWSEGMSRHDVMMQSIAEQSDAVLSSPEFKESLIRETGISENEAVEKIADIKDLTVKAAESVCYLAANFGIGAASTFEKAFNGLQIPVLMAKGENEKIQEVLGDGKTEQWKNALEEKWDDTQVNKTLGDSIKQFGETATVIALSVLASSGALDSVPGMSIAATAVVLLESIGNSFEHTARENGELDYRDVLVAAGATAATFAATKLAPIVNNKLMQNAPNLAEQIAQNGVETVDHLAKITGTIVKTGLGAVDTALFQAAAEASKVLRYSLGLDEDFDIKQELKNSGIAIATGAAFSGVGYYLKESIRNSSMFADLVKKFTGHEFVAEYDEFGKIAAGEMIEISGGSYKDVKKATLESGKEIHHIPADSSNELRRDDGPAIRMDLEDHRKTASWGNSKEAREYVARQKELLEQGKWREAIQMDIDDIRSKFGHKYDESIKQMLAYAEVKFGGM